MSSFPRRSRSLARIAVGLVALGVPLLAVSSAQAAMGTANQVTTTNPDVRTATILPLFNEVEVCFDGPIDLAPGAGAATITVDGYLAQNALSVATGPPTITSANCAKSQFPGSTNLEATTFTHVFAGGFKNLTNSQTNLTDSLPLNGSTTHNGTRGNSSQPDQTGVVVNEGQNQIAYLYDEELDLTGGSPACPSPFAPAANANFVFSDSQGAIHNDGFVISCSNTNNIGAVLVDFDLGPNPDPTSVSVAQRAWTRQNQVRAATHSGMFGAGNSLFSSIVPGKTGASNDPDLLSTELVTPDGSGNQMDFHYDENLANVVQNAFHVTLADSIRCTSTSANIINGDTVRATFGAGACPDAFAPNPPGPNPGEQVSEYWIGGFADPGAVQGSDDNAPVNDNGLPAGGNAGAFALGYSSGVDPLSATVNDAAGTVTILMDQRMITAAPNAQLVDDSGLTGIFGTPTSIGASAVPGQRPVTYQYAPSDLASAVGVFLPFGSIATNLGWTNEDQIIGIR